jgi:hypothetical protein
MRNKRFLKMGIVEYWSRTMVIYILFPFLNMQLSRVKIVFPFPLSIC